MCMYNEFHCRYIEMRTQRDEMAFPRPDYYERNRTRFRH